MKTLAERVIWARTRLGLTQTDLAKRAHVSQGTIGNIESGIRKQPRELLAIAAALRVRPEWLKNHTGPAEPSAPETHFVGEAGTKYVSPRYLTDQGIDLAQAVSHRQPIVTPKTIVWEDLKLDSIEGQFLMAVKGDALMPTYPPGQMAIWQAGDASTANPGQAVLVHVPDRGFELRFLERRGSTWAGVSQRAGFGELQPERDGAVVVARLRYLDLG